MFRQRTLTQLATRRQHVGACSALLGFDGFVDTIVEAVRLRRGAGDNFDAIASIPEFAERVRGAAGKSTNLELFPRREKLGGNCPIMANALLAAGARATVVAALGVPQIHPVFHPMAERARTVSLCEPARTTAIEFSDGKLMLGMMRSFDEISYERVLAAMGAAAFEAELASAQLVALVNWTMIPRMTDIFHALTERVLPGLTSSNARNFFFDLADPEKRSVDDLREALAAIGRFSPFGQVTLGLNLKEAQQVATVLDIAAPDDRESNLRASAAAIREQTGVAVVVIHPRDSAACATAAGTNWVPGPYVATPKITTGAGDHFNAGFAFAQLLGLEPEECLTMGVATSGYYVRTGESPTLSAIETFLANWH